MEYNYLVILDFLESVVVIVTLSEEQKRESLRYEDFTEFIETELHYNLNHCQWMALETLNIKRYGKEVNHAELG